jgi:predicted nuclease with TOPRIM domain
MSKHNTVQNSLILFFCVLTLSLLFFAISTPIYSQSVDELENIIQEKEEELNKQKTYLSDIEKRIKEIGSSNYTLTEQVNLLNKEIVKLQTEIDKRNSEIEEKLKIIDEKQKLLSRKKESLDLISAQLYMQSRYNDGQFLFSFSSLNDMLKTLFVKKSAINILKEDIEEITGEFVNLVELKKSLEDEKAQLDKEKKELDQSYALVIAEKSRVQKELNAQIAQQKNVKRTINGLSTQLSDLQYQLLIARQGGTYVNLDSIPASSNTITSLRGFLKQAPSESFGVFLFGAYTHRDGMSQWGAKARANAGQNYQQILNAYYPGKVFRTGSVVIGGVEQSIMTNISTTTYGELNFEDEYLLRLAEVPESWPMEVLKAQAIAARTYAVNYTQNGKNSICTSQSCQVVNSSQKTGAWKTAVQATRGIIMTDGAGAPFSAKYAAVHGGWSNTSGWDTTDKTGDGDWMSRAWDSISGVSWFYRTWYGDTEQEGNGTCSRSPWLSQAEMSDIVNIFQIWKEKGGNDPRIYPVQDACHGNKGQYSREEAKSLAAKPVTSISSVLVSSSNGTTNSVIFYTNAGPISMTGNEFKTIYNLRAPGHLHIPQSGFVHINIHMK